MKRELNLNEIQGNVNRAYGRYSFPFARYFFLNIKDSVAGRKFVDDVSYKITTASRWNDENKPQCTLNIAFSFPGLLQLEVSARTLRGMPSEFIDGMKARAFVLGDRDITKTAAEDADWARHWDPIWRRNRAGAMNSGDDVHIWISMNAQLKAFGMDEPVDDLEVMTKWLRDLCKESDGGVTILGGHGREGDQDYQSASAVFKDVNGAKIPTAKEHFGFTDGIGDPVFEGQYPPDVEKHNVIGRGKRMNSGEGWTPIAAGEFILGYPDESQELPPAAVPPEFVNNGTFMVYRKLHENVGSFDEVLSAEAKRFAAEMEVSVEEAEEILRAKMCGRWSNGVPLALVPTYGEWKEFCKTRGFDDPDSIQAMKNLRAFTSSSEASDFRYADDMAGYKCPVGSHLRRMNTRDHLDPTNKVGIDPATGDQYVNDSANTALNKRRRVLRRGLPYGSSSAEGKSDDTEQGVIFMVIGSSLFRQFEFVQQQWMQYGLDFNEGNNTCPVLGNHDQHKRFMIASDPKSGKPPYIMSKLKTFVECRGGEYFFVPSMTALRMMAMGIVDPT